VDVTDGALSGGQGLSGVAVFLGAGEPAVKSAALLSVSAQPLAARASAVVFVVAGAGEDS
jgi:hypothetical protein